MAAQAVILAAGNGSRLAGSFGRTPKCLVEIGGRPLILHQLAALDSAGVDDVVVVVGFEHDQVRAVVGPGVRLVMNGRFAETNSLYSFLLAGKHLHDGAFVLNADVLFPSHLPADLARISGCSVAYDSSSGAHDEHMKVALERGRLVKMSKRLGPELTTGENLGILHLDREGVGLLLAAAELFVEEGAERAWLASAMNVVALARPVVGYDVAGIPWVEIDFPEDLARARSEVWPAIRDLPGHASSLNLLTEPRTIVALDSDEVLT